MVEVVWIESGVGTIGGVMVSAGGGSVVTAIVEVFALLLLLLLMLLLVGVIGSLVCNGVACGMLMFIGDPETGAVEGVGSSGRTSSTELRLSVGTVLACTTTVIDPREVNFSAFPTRFIKI